MPIRLQPGFFDIHERTGKLTEIGDPLVGLNEQIDWEAFRPSLNVVYEKARKSNAGAKPIDATFVEVPRQGNTREENSGIKSGNPPEEWDKKPVQS
jgi:hypothetical protein